MHCESFDATEVKYFKYSMSTKIPEYLSVGRPILCYGPNDVCTVSYLRENEVGFVVENDQELIMAINKLQDIKTRVALGKNAIEVAKRDHLVKNVSDRVEDVFRINMSLWEPYKL